MRLYTILSYKYDVFYMIYISACGQLRHVLAGTLSLRVCPHMSDMPYACEHKILMSLVGIVIGSPRCLFLSAGRVVRNRGSLRAHYTSAPLRPRAVCICLR